MLIVKMECTKSVHSLQWFIHHLRPVKKHEIQNTHGELVRVNAEGEPIKRKRFRI